MGSILSGRYGKRAHRDTVDDFLRLDVREMARTGALTPGRMFALEWQSNGRQKARIAHISGIAERDRISFHDAGLNYTLRLEWMRCTLGGRRPFFRCPKCRERFCILYRAGGYSCRKCLGLGYPVQRESRRDRTLRRARRVMGRVGYDEGRKYGKPKWQRWRTFWRLYDAAERASELEEAANAPLVVLLRKLHRADRT